jgi:hypothetical protein
MLAFDTTLVSYVRSRIGPHEPCPISQHHARADGGDDVDDRRELGLHAARLERSLNALPAVRIESPLLVVLAGERLDHLDRAQRLGDAGEELAFLPPYGARRLLDPSRVEVDDQSQHRRDRQCHQSEAPVDIQHDADHPDQRQDVHDEAEQRRVDEILDGVDVARDPADHVAGARFAVLDEREPLDPVIQHQPQIVRDPLADGGGEILFGVRADRAQHGDEDDGRQRENQDGNLVVADPRDDDRRPSAQLLVLQHVVDDDLDRPRFEDVGERFADHRDERQRKRHPVRADEVADPQLARTWRDGIDRHCRHALCFRPLSASASTS